MGQLYLIILLWMQQIHEREIIKNQYTQMYEYYIEEWDNENFYWEEIDLSEYERNRCCGCEDCDQVYL